MASAGICTRLFRCDLEDVIRLLEQSLETRIAAQRIKQRTKPQLVDRKTGRRSERVLDDGHCLIELTDHDANLCQIIL